MKPPLEVVDGPTIADGTVRRHVRFADGSGQCQRWERGRWVRGGDVTFMLTAPWCRREELRRLGIPLELAPDHPDR